VRYEIELQRLPDQRIEGSIVWAGLEKPLQFNGWLELLRLLEIHTCADAEES
jgi:hypothetical protein